MATSLPAAASAQGSSTDRVQVRFCRADSVLVRLENPIDYYDSDRAIERIVEAAGKAAGVVMVLRPNSAMKHAPVLRVYLESFSKAKAQWLAPGAEATDVAIPGFSGAWTNGVDANALQGLVQGAVDEALKHRPPSTSCK